MLNKDLLTKLKGKNPLIHNITNIVVANDVANTLIAIGASPFMASAKEEMEEASSFSNALVLNIGTITSTVAESMILSGKAANKQGVPVVLDPVGVGATTFRKKIVKRLFNEIDFTLVRGNAGEIATLADVEWESKGVDAGEGTASRIDIAKKVAKEKHTIVAVSGKEDVVSDGEQSYSIANGNERMARITGSGCMLSGLSGAFLSIANKNRLEAILTSHIVFGVAGEQAANREDVRGPGTFRAALIDELEKLRPEDIETKAKYEVK